MTVNDSKISTRLCQSDQVQEKSKGFGFNVVKDDRVWPAFIIRFAGKIKGYLNVCPHMAFRLDAGTGKFFSINGGKLICTSHGAMFDPDDGRCSGGPCAGFSLIPLALREENGAIFLDEGEYRYWD